MFSLAVTVLFLQKEEFMRLHRFFVSKFVLFEAKFIRLFA